MKRSMCYLLACASLWGFAQVQAGEIWLDGCWWDPDWPEGPATYISDVGTRYIARDAPIGTPIMLEEERGEHVGLTATPHHMCHRAWDGNEIVPNPTNVWLNVANASPLFPGDLPPIAGIPLAGKVIQTSIPGVGAHVRLGLPFTGRFANEWKADGGVPVVPFIGRLEHWTQGYVSFQRMRFFLTLVKTGPIPPGVHEFDNRRLLSATSNELGQIFHWALQGRIAQNQCSVPANPVSADPVQLGTWDRNDFTGVDFTTPAVAFHITLSDCADNPENNVTTAHIRLEGTKGSAPIDAQRGIFSLTGDSSASGLGIQMLMADGITPVPLDQDVPLKVIPISGNTLLPFTARYYQTGPSAQVLPGSARGALNFTVTYQ